MIKVKTFSFLCLLAVSATSAAASRHSQLSVSEALDLTVNPPQVTIGASTLQRHRRSVEMNYRATGLAPGVVYTAWWVVFNHPSRCTTPCGLDDVLNPDASQSSMIWADGRIASPDGMADFTARLHRGKSPPGLFFGPGLKYPRRAEVHLVLRDHGMPIPGMVGEQLTTLDGGCPTGCIDVQATVHAD